MCHIQRNLSESRQFITRRWIYHWHFAKCSHFPMWSPQIDNNIKSFEFWFESKFVLCRLLRQTKRIRVKNITIQCHNHWLKWLPVIALQWKRDENNIANENLIAITNIFWYAKDQTHLTSMMTLITSCAEPIDRCMFSQFKKESESTMNIFRCS